VFSKALKNISEFEWKLDVINSRLLLVFPELLNFWKNYNPSLRDVNKATDP